MRRISARSRMRVSRCITSSPLTPSASPTAWYGRGTSGKPPCVAWIRARSSGSRRSEVSVGMVPSNPESQVQEILLEFRHGIHRMAGALFDARNRFVDAPAAVGRQDEPEVEGVLAQIVVRDFRMGIDDAD